MASIFDVFKTDSMKQQVDEEKAEIEYIRSRKEVEHNVFDSLMREFKIDSSVGLKQTVSPQEPPTAVLRHENQAFSLWYRLPIKGESRGVHIIDFALFRGTHRIANRVYPDFIVECRQIESAHSNRTDPRIIRDIIGLALDTLPGMLILATNRELSEPAKDMAAAYGIQLININEETAAGEMADLITSDKQTTRVHLLRNIDTATTKIESLITKRAATPWGKKILEEKHERLKDKVLAELASRKMNVIELSRALHTHADYILNELYGLEKENKARIVERSMKNDLENIWALNIFAKK